MSALEQIALEAHPAAELFPPMTATEFTELTENIRTHGLREPIVTLNDLILDGRHRLRACGITGVTPRFVEWDGSGGSATDFVVSLNMFRRHLSKSQKAMIAVDSRPLYEAEAREAKRAGQTHGGFVRQGSLSPIVEESSAPVETAKRAADAFGVGKSYVYQAARIQDVDPSLAEDVRAGKTTVAKALHKVKKARRESAKPEPFEITTERQRQLAEASKARIERAVGTCNGLARGLKELTPAMAVSVSTSEEIAGWDEAFSDAITAIRALRTRLKEAQ